jgi:hypothetical protein
VLSGPCVRRGKLRMRASVVPVNDRGDRAGGFWLLHSLSVAVSVMQLASITFCTLLSTSMCDKLTSLAAGRRGSARLRTTARPCSGATVPKCTSAAAKLTAQCRQMLQHPKAEILQAWWRKDNRQALNDSRYTGWRAQEQKVLT